jgi:hypothetical protein
MIKILTFPCGGGKWFVHRVTLLFRMITLKVKTEESKKRGVTSDGVVKSPVFVIARSSANAGRQSNPVFSRTYKNEIASLSLAMTLLPTFYEIITSDQ